MLGFIYKLARFYAIFRSTWNFIEPFWTRGGENDYRRRRPQLQWLQKAFFKWCSFFRWEWEYKRIQLAFTLCSLKMFFFVPFIQEKSNGYNVDLAIDVLVRCSNLIKFNNRESAFVKHILKIQLLKCNRSNSDFFYH